MTAPARLSPRPPRAELAGGGVLALPNRDRRICLYPLRWCMTPGYVLPMTNNETPAPRLSDADREWMLACLASDDDGPTDSDEQAMDEAAALLAARRA